MFGTQSGSQKGGGFTFNTISDDDLYAIHLATLRVLYNTGVKVHNEQALNIYADSGCIVNRDSKIVKIPSYVVEDAIRSAPREIVLCGRNPKYDVVLGAKKVYFTNFGEGIMVYDPYTGEYRSSTKQDCANAALMTDALEEVDVCLRAVSANDTPPEVHMLHETEVAFLNTSKPVFVGGFNGHQVDYVYQMAVEVAGGADKLKERKIFAINTCPTSPLQLTNDVCETIMKCAEYDIPVNLLSMAMAGGSAPITLAGTLVVHNAEVLAGIVLAQLVKKGAPVIYGSSTTMMDLRLTTAPVGSPEFSMINSAVATLAQYYLLPSWVAGG